MFTKMVTAVQLEETLNTEGPITIFAPNNEAFSELPPDILKTFFSDQEGLAEVLNYHLVPGNFLLDDLYELPTLLTRQGGMLIADLYDHTLTLNDAAVIIDPDIRYASGFVHIIDAVLFP